MKLPADPLLATEWLGRRLAAFDPGQRPGDVPWRDDLTETRPAAVLVPLIWHPDRATVLLTRRTDGLRDHAGQVSFPGGKVDPEDADAVAAALREAREEIALDSALVHPIGALPQYVTITGYAVTPVVGLIVPPFEVEAQPGEVAEIFELPLELALDVRNYERHSYEREGRRGFYLSLSYREHFVWGATAAMLRLLARALTDQ